MRRMLCLIAALGCGVIGQAVLAQDDEDRGPPVCKEGTSAKVTGLVSTLGEDGQIELENGAASACLVEYIDVKGKFPPECKDKVRITASGTIRHEKSSEDDETYYVLDKVKDLKCESLDALTPAGCKGGAVVTATGTIKEVAPGQSKEGGWVVHLAPGKGKEGCSFRYMHTVEALPASCAKGSNITATGHVDANLDWDGTLDMTLTKLESFKCAGAAATAAAANAAKDCAKEFGIPVDQRIAACTELIMQHPEDAVGYRRRGIAYSHECGRDEKSCGLANADLTKSLELAGTPGREQALLYYWRAVNSWKKDKERAFADLAKAIELDPQDTSHYSTRARYLSARDEYHAAIRDYDKLIGLQPGEAAHYDDRGWVYQQLGDYGRALADYQIAVTIEPRDDRKRAIAKLKAFPANPDPATECAAELSRDLALKACTRAIEKDAKAAVAYFHRAHLYADQYLGKQNFEQALADYNKAIELDPKQASYLEGRAHVFSSMNAPEKQLADYDKMIELEPKNAGFYARRAGLYSDHSVFDKAIADWTKAIELEPGLAAFNLCDRADDYEAAGDAKRAEADRKAAEKLGGEEGYCEED